MNGDGAPEGARLSDPAEALAWAVTVHALTTYLPPTGHVLVLGDNLVPATHWLAQRGYQVVQAGLAPGGLDRAAPDQAATDRTNQVETVDVADAQDLSRWAAASFDAALCFGPFSRWPAADRERTAAELARMLRPAGVAFATWPTRLGYLRRALVRPSERHQLRVPEALGRLLRNGAVPADGPAPADGYGAQPDEIAPFFARFGFALLALLSTQGLAVGLEEAVAALATTDPAAHRAVLDVLLQTAGDPGLLGLGDHLLYVGQRRTDAIALPPEKQAEPSAGDRRPAPRRARSGKGTRAADPTSVPLGRKAQGAQRPGPKPQSGETAATVRPTADPSTSGPAVSIPQTADPGPAARTAGEAVPGEPPTPRRTGPTEPPATDGDPPEPVTAAEPAAPDGPLAAPPGPVNSGDRLSDLVPRFLDFCVALDRAEHTQTSLRVDLALLIRFLGDRAVSAVTLDDLRRYALWLRRDRHNDPRSLRRKVASLKAFFDYARQLGWRDDDPAERLLYPHLDPHPPEFLEPAEEAALIAATERPLWRALVLTLLDTGLKRDEVLALHPADLILDPQAPERSALTVRAAQQSARIRARTLPVTARLLPALQQHLATGAAERVFPISARAVNAIVETSGERAGLRRRGPISPQMLRDTFAMREVRRRVAEEERQQRAGAGAVDLAALRHRHNGEVCALLGLTPGETNDPIARYRLLIPFP